MKIKKDSILLQIIFYNDIAIILTSLAIAFFFTFMLFERFDENIKKSSREKILILSKLHKNNISDTRKTIENEINQIVLSKTPTKDEYPLLLDQLKKIIFKKSDDYFKNSLFLFVDEELNLIEPKKVKNANDKLISIKNFLNENKEDLSTIKNMGSTNLIEQDELFSIINIPYNINGDNLNFLLIIPLKLFPIHRVEEYMILSTEDRFFLFSEGNYELWDFNLNKENYKEQNDKKKFETSYNNYSFYEQRLNNNPYYISTYELLDYNSNKIASLGIAISKEHFSNMKFYTLIFVLIIVFISIIVSTTLSASVFRKLLLPIENLIGTTDEISKGKYNIDLKDNSIPEIKKLFNSIKKMANKISHNEQTLKENNLNLKNNLKRIEAIEKILMGINIEEDFTLGIKGILSAFTSPVGLGYNRAIYLNYNGEKDVLIGEMSSINPKVVPNIEDSENTFKGFKFQINDLETLVPFIKVPFDNSNLIAKSLNTMRIIYKNDKGYKYDLGSDIFKSLGLNHFIILPIFSENINKGCIIVDYFDEDIEISKEEVELITILLLNISIRIRNKQLEEQKIDKERSTTLIKASTRFLRDREDFLLRLQSFIEKIKESDYNNVSIEKDIKLIEKQISRINKENNLFKEYSEMVKRDFELIYIEDLINELVEIQEQEFNRLGIEISVFIGFNGYIYGDRIRLIKMFEEIIKNSIDSLLIRNKSDKKINIVVTKEKNSDKVAIDIIDNGIGLSEKELKGLTEPYAGYSKANTIGLGLSVVYNIVRDHEGIIIFSSKLDEGTDVKIIFKIHEEEQIND